MAAAVSIFQNNLAEKLILVDKNEDLAKGEAMDLMHAQGYNGRCSVSFKQLEELDEIDIIIISAGVSQKDGETRLDLLNRNAIILKNIIQSLDKTCPHSLIIMATNPVDILTYVAQDLSSRNSKKIIGTGTMLDTSRFRSLLGEYYNVDPKSVHAYVVGEHGNSEVLLWSSAAIAGKSILDSKVLGKKIDKESIEKITSDVTYAAYSIIEKKGYTSWAIGIIISHMVSIISQNKKSVVPLSVRVEDYLGVSKTCLGLPVVLGREGVEEILPIQMSKEEENLFKASGEMLANIISEMDY